MAPSKQINNKMSKNKSNQFKSSRPRKYTDISQYCKEYGGTGYMIDLKQNGHSYGEVCANCGKPFGVHFGDVAIAKCE